MAGLSVAWKSVALEGLRRYGKAGLGEFGDQRLGEFRVVGAYRFYTDAAFAEHAEALGGGVGKVDDGVGFVGTAVVHADKGGAHVGEIGDTQPAAQGQGAVRAGKGVHIEPLAGGGTLALKGAAIPGGAADLKPAVDFAGGRGLCGSALGGQRAGDNTCCESECGDKDGGSFAN